MMEGPEFPTAAGAYDGAVPAWEQLIQSDPRICGGAVCLAGTRVPVSVVLDSLAEGSTREEILRSYPTLRQQHIDAALAYAAELARVERLIPLHTD
jgi:uncharacterized protein (DUF433 family)